MKKVLVLLVLSLLTITIKAQQAVDSIATKYLSVLDDANIKSYFNMSLSSGLHAGVTSNKVIGSNVYHAVEIGVKVSTLFSNLFHCNENQIELPGHLADKVLSYCFKEEGLSSKEAGEKLLLKRLLENLKLKTILTEVMQDVLVIEVVDTLKLNQAKAVQRSETGITEIKTEGTNIISIQNGTLNTLSEELKRALTTQVVINRKDLLTNHYDFHLKKGSLEILQASLLKYGLNLKKEQKKLPKYRFED